MILFLFLLLKLTS
jgi:DNA-binding CsgD family transcriptional regulator